MFEGWFCVALFDALRSRSEAQARTNATSFCGVVATERLCTIQPAISMFCCLPTELGVPLHAARRRHSGSEVRVSIEGRVSILDSPHCASDLRFSICFLRRAGSVAVTRGFAGRYAYTMRCVRAAGTIV